MSQNQEEQNFVYRIVTPSWMNAVVDVWLVETPQNKSRYVIPSLRITHTTIDEPRLIKFLCDRFGLHHLVGPNYCHVTVTAENA